jgi:hypothetical protein
MPKIDYGMDRCFCEPEEKSETAAEEEFCYWLAPVLFCSDIGRIDLSTEKLPVRVWCVEDSLVYGNNGRGWFYIDEFGILQDV